MDSRGTNLVDSGIKNTEDNNNLEPKEVDTNTEDNASVLVIILQGETRQCNTNINNLKWVFSDPYFTVQICAADTPTITTTKTLDHYQYMENYSMRKALTYASEGPYMPNTQGTLVPQYWWKDIPVIIVKDSSISNVVPAATKIFKDNNPDEIGGMKHRIKIALEKAKTADLFFLCKWNDACDKHVDIEGAIDHGSTLKWSLRPTSTQAIMYKPSSRDYIRGMLKEATIPLSNMLNSDINKEKLSATVFVPNIIDFDISLATSNNDYNKLNECAQVTNSEENNTSMAAIIWLGIIAIIIIFVAWIVIRYIPE